jgi:glycosyltransferase involved in cell wall biosynthesis
MSIPKLSLCIPTYNRWNFLKNNLPKYLENPFLDEIVITDETGEDIKLIQEHFQNPKLKLFVNEKRLHAFLNKREAVLKASNDWICLIDSDNFAPIEYFEAWKNYVEQNGFILNAIYSPSKTIPQEKHSGFDYREFINQNISFFKAQELYKTTKYGPSLFNTGNFILHKSMYTNYQPTIEDIQTTLHCPALECLYQNYLFFTKCNAIMIVVKDMEYHHIVHDESLYLTTYKSCDLNRVEKYFK